MRETERVPGPDGKVCDLAPNCTQILARRFLLRQGDVAFQKHFCYYGNLIPNLFTLWCVYM